MKCKYVAFWLLLAPAVASAFNGSISFTELEQRAHEAALPAIMDAATACLRRDLTLHVSFYRQWRISPFFGDQSSFA